MVATKAPREPVSPMATTPISRYPRQAHRSRGWRYVIPRYHAIGRASASVIPRSLGSNPSAANLVVVCATLGRTTIVSSVLT